MLILKLGNVAEVAEDNLEVRVDNAQGIGVAENRNSSVIRDIVCSSFCSISSTVAPPDMMASWHSQTMIIAVGRVGDNFFIR